jgi:hypothetical protein
MISSYVSPPKVSNPYKGTKSHSNTTVEFQKLESFQYDEVFVYPNTPCRSYRWVCRGGAGRRCSGMSGSNGDRVRPHSMRAGVICLSSLVLTKS